MAGASTTSPPVLVTGATGYLGSRLVTALLAQGHTVRAFVRSPQKVDLQPWAKHPQLQVAQGDMDDPESIAEALKDCRAAYYLVHRMESGVQDFFSADHRAATHFAKAAEATPSLTQILYLGGLGQEGPDLSRHLQSRHEVEALLQASHVPVTILRAAMVIGAGSASFEILRYLTERLPIMIAPKWLYVPCQPIGVRNVIGYLAGVLGNQAALGKSFDVGGPDVVTYRKLIALCGQEAGLGRRLVVPVPILSPRLSSYWIGLVTPVPSAIAKPLAEGLRNPVVCQNDDIKTVVPQDLLSCRKAIRLAIQTPPGTSDPESTNPGDAAWAGGTSLHDSRELHVDQAPEQIWGVVEGLGGTQGWHGANWLWRVRGHLDWALGGVGMRGRKDGPVMAGDSVDFWAVEDIHPGNRLLLRSQMKLPGDGSLEFTLHEDGAGTQLRQEAAFRPRGLGGIAYWYALLPVHKLVFRRLIHGIQKAAKRNAESGAHPGK